MYSFNDDSINNIITESIYQDVKEVIQQDIKNVKIEDYFPKDIIDNFDFSYVGTPSIGNVTDGIDKETRSITWNIENLKGNEVATLKYNLKIKDMNNKNLLNKTIPTNEKVVLIYNDIENEKYTVTLESSPKIQLSEVKEPIKDNNDDDSTVAKGELPQTGVGIGLVSAIIILCSISIIWYFRCNKMKEI